MITIITPENWIDVIIKIMQNAVIGKQPIVWTDDSGKTILVNVEQEMIDMLVQNRDKFFVIGMDVFKQFCSLMNKGQSFEALVTIYSAMDNDQLVDQYKEDALKLAEIARIEQETRNFWIWLAEQVSMRLVLGAIGSLIP